MTRKTIKRTDGYLYKATISEPHLGSCPFFSGGVRKGTDQGRGEGFNTLCVYGGVGVEDLFS